MHRLGFAREVLILALGIFAAGIVTGLAIVGLFSLFT